MEDDCIVSIDSTAEAFVHIAINTAKAVRAFGDALSIVILSYSDCGTDIQDQQAMGLVKQLELGLQIDGDIYYLRRIPFQVLLDEQMY